MYASPQKLLHMCMACTFRITTFAYVLACFFFLWVESLETYLKNQAWSDGGHAMKEEVAEQTVVEHVVEKYCWAVWVLVLQEH